MALGYCMGCECLKSIRPGAQKWGSRECAWSPVEHVKHVHVGCGSLVIDGDHGSSCDVHGDVPLDHVTEVRCEGSGKEIK